MKEEKEFTKKEVAKIFDEILNLGNKPVVHITDRGASYVSPLGIIASLPQTIAEQVKPLTAKRTL